MSVTWQSNDPPPPVRLTPSGWARAILRGGAILIVLGLGLIVLFALRAVEWPIYRDARPWSPWIVHWVCRIVCRILGLRRVLEGNPITGPGAVVANHASWLDIFTLNAAMPVTFVSKSEVADWPGIGFVARAAGTRFISRRAAAAADQRQILADTLKAGHRPLFFPEGTSTDGQRVLNFKSTIFGAFFIKEIQLKLQVQPVSVRYFAPAGQDVRFYGWWGDMSFGAHALKVLAQHPQGTAVVICHAPLNLSDIPDRKALARITEQTVTEGFRRATALGSRAPDV